ncbi:hypothetical protein MLD38_013858 [Melastoma candidum]|uniref:Uncharacterized protein n=1 Tax=Melastoma candidum TaxID=119954 RepID=A0ACB9RAX8_9MYRT|nr:hypothetical protein MLD38_013858 [Melastoma candidum]
MAGSPSVGSGSTVVENSGSEEDLQVALVDLRKRKRMLSNRESARRSRIRKQRHLDELAAQASRLRGENHQLVSAMNTVTQHYLSIETENSILRVQIDELSNRLDSLNEIITFSSGNAKFNFNCDSFFDGGLGFANQQKPILASADMFQY